MLLSVEDIPGPKGLPFVGTLWNYVKKNGFKFNKLFEVKKSFSSFHFSQMQVNGSINQSMDHIRSRSADKKWSVFSFQAHAFHFNEYGPFFREQLVGRNFNVIRDLKEWRTKVIQQEPKCPQRCALEPMVRYRKMRGLSQGLVNS